VVSVTLTSPENYCPVISITPYSVPKLAKYLDAEVGSELTIIGSTIDGMVNAVDVKIGEITNTGSASTDDKSLLMSLALAAGFRYSKELTGSSCYSVQKT